MKLRILVAALGLALWSASAFGLYIRPDLENVPVAKLVENIEKAVQKNAKDAQARLNLARVHAMAYALKTDTTPVRKVKGGKLEERAWFGYEPRHVPFALKKTDDATRQKAAKEHLAKAVEHYKETVKLAPENLTARLGLAWCLDQAKEIMAAIKEYRTVVEEGWKKEKDLKSAGLGWHSVTAEAIGYLMPHLDKERDREEIAALKARTDKLRQVIRPITPIAVPLRDGLKARDLVNEKARVAFDLDGSGRRDTWTWITRDAAWLVYDQHNTKQITSGLHLFGNVTFWLFWDNGYQALAALDETGDGQIAGEELRGLALWHDANCDGVCDPDEVKPLADHGIVALSCRYETDTAHPDRIAFSPAGVRFADGSTRSTFDVVLRRR